MIIDKLNTVDKEYVEKMIEDEKYKKEFIEVMLNVICALDIYLTYNPTTINELHKLGKYVITEDIKHLIDFYKIIGVDLNGVV